MRLPLGSLIDTLADRALIGYSDLGYRLRRTGWPDDDPPPDALRGRTAIVTGARTGIGQATAVGLAALGARVRMVVRDPEKAADARAAVLAAVPGADVVLDACDVSSIAAARAYGTGVAAEGDHLAVVVHNAGILPPQRRTTDEGHELAFATHVLGPHALTAALRPALAASGGRVVWVSSGGMYAQALKLDDLEYERGDYSGTTAYARTKRMQVALAQEWGRRTAGEGLTVHAMHPGWVDTPGIAESLPTFGRLAHAILRSPAEGADTIVWLAGTTHLDPPTGGFWHDRRARPTAWLGLHADDAGQRAALWDAVDAATGLLPVQP